MAREEFVHGDDQRRVAGVQHVVEHEEPCRVHDRAGELEIARQRRPRVLAVDVHEARRPAAEALAEVRGRHLARARLPREAPAGRDAVGGAVRLEALDDTGVGPFENVDAERHLGCSALASAMKKRPSNVPISTTGPVTPNSPW